MEIHYIHSSSNGYTGPAGARGFVAVTIHSMIGTSREVYNHELPDDLRNADEAQFLASTYAAPLIVEAKAELMRRFTEAQGELEMAVAS